MPPRTLKLSLPDGDEGTRETLKMMRLLVLEGRDQPLVREAAVNAVRNVKRMDWAGELRACWWWVLENIRYTRDTNETEMLHFATQILAQRAGDCDDASILLAAMLESVGVETAFIAVKLDGGIHYAHVFVMAECSGQWITLDATEPRPFGWSPPNVTGRPMVIYNKECGCGDH